jgi:Fe-S cluster biosynthesis and repair protein YggX
MKKLINKILLLGLVSIPMISNAQVSQYMCNGVVQDCIYNKKDGYVYNQQSQSGAFMQGDTAQVTIVVYKNMDYRISACCPDYEEMDGKLKFRIIEEVKEAAWVTKTVTETVTETVYNEDEFGNMQEENIDKEVTKEVKKRVFSKKKVVRYDGYKDEEASLFEFISDKTRKLIVEVYIPEVGGEGGDLEAGQVVCVGLLIEHRPAPKNLGKFGK